MKIQKKALLVFVILLIAVLIGISVFFSTVLLASYSTLEEQYIEKDLGQAANKLNDELFSMSSIASDWGPWDDTVDFVNGNDPEYINSNLQAFGFDNLNLNLIVLTNTKGEILFSGAYDLNNKVMVPIPAFFSGKMDLQNPLMNMSEPHHITTGILMLPEAPMLIVSQPIVQSNYSGQPQGVVIMGRYLNKEEIARLAALTRPSLTLTRINDPALSPDLVSRIRDNSGSAPGIIRQLNMDTVAGDALIRDIYGNEALVLEITEARSIYHQGINTTLQVIFIILTGGLFLGLLVIILLDRVVLKRMGSLAFQVNSIGKSGSTRDHVVIEGDDELSGLATEINRMLETIEKFHIKLSASEARFREMSDLLPQIIFELDTNANVTYVNKYGEELFDVSENDLINCLNARQIIIPEDIERVGRNLKKVAAGEKSPGEIYTMVKKDKSTLRAIMFTSPIFHDGQLVGFRGSGIDITERLKLEDALYESEEYLQSLIRSIRSGIIVIDAKTHTIVDVNPAALEMIGTTKDAVLNQKCHKVICPAEVGKCPITDLNQMVDNSERTLLTHDGRKISIIKSVVPVLLHGKPCLLETFIDNTYRKQIELKLAESEEKYRALAENSADIIFSLDLTGIFTYISPQVSRYGYTPHEITGKGIQQFIYPADQAKVLNNYRNEIHDRISIASTFRIVDKRGALHWIEENSNIKRDEQGNPKGMVGILRDVTDRVQAEEALRESEQRFDQLAEQSGTIAWEVDAQGLYTYVNHVSETVWGYRPDELVGRMHFYDLHPESGREAFKTIAFSIFKRKEPFWNLENSVQAKDGHKVAVSTNGIPILNLEGILTGYRGSDTDITERKLAEEELAESEGKYRALTENTGDILFSMAMTGIITYISPQVNKYGYLEEEIIGKTFKELIHPEDIAKVESDLYHDLEKGAQFHSTFRVLDKWGNVHWFDEKGTLRLDQSGKPIGIYGVLRDDSERRRAEDALGLANKKLNLMNNITRHDILNTITGIYGCVDMAKAAYSADERDPLLNDIKDLIMIIQRQITFTREYQEVGVNLPQWQNLNDLIHKALQNFAKSGITFSTEFERIEIYADPLLEKVFYNLVDNAIRYGETITTISIYPDISDKGLSLIFKDDGVGVEAGQKQEIFKRGVGKNTGMGLFLTAEILAITGITIEENGIFKMGARFEIRIPNGVWRIPRD